MQKIIEMRAGELLAIPLSQLTASARNARKTGGSDSSDLKASIKAQGALQNLIVCPAQTEKGKPTGKYEVVGGARRLSALSELAAEGEIASDEAILCCVKPTRDAAAASLAENVARMAMHPADEFDAFKRLVDEGMSIDEVAARFGTSELTVRRRLKLASVHPALLALYREDGIGLEQLMALAVSDDVEQQLRVWERSPAWQRDASVAAARARCRRDRRADDPLAKLVGIAAYQAAGGAVRRDLFCRGGWRLPAGRRAVATACGREAAASCRADARGRVVVGRRGAAHQGRVQSRACALGRA
jgi:ParB family chromosome partitioning protein